MVADNKRCVLFDLDGTLADTAPDLANALNATLQQFGREPLAFATIRPHVSHGGIALIRLGFGIEPEHADFEKYRRFLLDFYNNNICEHTRLFAGMDELLTYLEQNAVSWGIVTNKPSWLTDPLMRAMQLDKRAVSIISGDTCTNRKPHPEPVLAACSQARADPAQCFYVGDAQRDIQAGNAAGCTTITALFGYIDDNDDPQSWQSDYAVNHPAEIIDIISRHSPAC